jgi:16S rRNA (guanine1516-N2)-methyltransferase
VKLKALNELLVQTDYQLLDTPEGLALTHDEYSPLIIDFLSSASQYRKIKGGMNQLVVKACLGTKKTRVFDLTAGLGRDAYVLASLGCQVKMFERHPIVAALLCDGLKRLKQFNHDISLSLIQKDSQIFLASLDESNCPDVIYFDPMHPSRKKSALVKKEMRILSEIVGMDEDKIKVFELARQKAKKRVVVKWPVNELPIADAPTMTYKGKTTRFDVYLNGVN